MKNPPVDWTETRESVFSFMNTHQEGFFVLCPVCRFAMPMYVCIFELDEDIADAEWTWCTHCGTVFTYWP